MPQSSDITVVIPLFNGADFLPATFEALDRQRLRPDEIVVVDDGSSDNSYEIAKAHQRVVPFRNPSKGANHARAFGFSRVRTGMVAFVDQDDLLHPLHFDCLSRALSAHSEVPLAAGGIRPFSSVKAPDFPDRVVEGWERFDPWNCFPMNPVGSSSPVLLRSDALREAGGWETRFEGIADYYSWMRLTVHRPMLRTNALTVFQRRHDASYGSKLRDPLRLCRWLAIRIEGSRELARIRQEAHPEETLDLKRRLELMETLAEIAAALVNESTSELIRSAHKVEQFLSQESGEYSGAFWAMFRWFFAYSGYSGFVDWWPLDAPITRQALIRSVGRRDLFKSWFQTPVNRMRLRALLSALRD